MCVHFLLRVHIALLSDSASSRVAVRPGKDGAPGGKSGRRAGYAMRYIRKQGEEKPSQKQSQGMLSQARNLQQYAFVVLLRLPTPLWAELEATTLCVSYYILRDTPALSQETGV